MTQHPAGVTTTPVLCYRDDDGMRSRNVSPVVLTGQLDVPAPPARLVAEWKRETLTAIGSTPGGVEQLSLPRARMRWPQLKSCVAAATRWLQSCGIEDVLSESEIALMTCRGAAYHNDAAQYGAKAFFNLFLSEDLGLDLHFPAIGLRMPLTRGTVVVFDTAQAHGVIRRGSTHFDAADFAPDSDSTQIFLTWELPLDHPHVAQAMGVAISPAGLRYRQHRD